MIIRVGRLVVVAILCWIGGSVYVGTETYIAKPTALSMLVFFLPVWVIVVSAGLWGLWALWGMSGYLEVSLPRRDQTARIEQQSRRIADLERELGIGR